MKIIRFPALVNWSVRYTLESQFSFRPELNLVRIGSFLKRSKREVIVQDDVLYKRVTIRINGNGVTVRDQEVGRNIGTKRQFLATEGQFLISKIDARNGAMGIAPSKVNGAIITADFLAFDIDTSIINSYFFWLLSTTKQFIAFCQSCSSGTTNRQRLDEQLFLDLKIPLPHLDVQQTLVKEHQATLQKADLQEIEAEKLKNELETYLMEKSGIKSPEVIIHKKGIHFFEYKDVREWGIDKLFYKTTYLSSLWNTVTLDTHPILARAVYRGKSPVYDETSDKAILNQKCVRWNTIETRFAKRVNRDWYNQVETELMTQEGDILVNSTGEGTIGRSAAVMDSSVGYLFDSHVLLARLNTELLNPCYFSEVINSPYGQRQINDIKSAQSTKQTELGVANLRRIVIPLPPMDVQEQIISTLNNLKSRAQTLRIEAVELRQNAIKAFEQAIFTTSPN